MSTRTVLTPNNVLAVHRDCLYNGFETDKYTSVPNVLDSFDTCYENSKLEDNADKITSMVKQLARRFRDEDGAPFQDVGLDNHDDTWSINDEATLQQLVQLGYARGLIQFVESRKDSKGRPYIRVVL